MASSKLTPDYHALDYEALLHEAQQECATSMAAFLRQRLPFKWRDLYVAACSRPTNIVRFQCGSFEYLFDIYSELEVIGEIPYDQTVEDRVVAVLGMSAGLDEPRVATRMRGWLGESGELVAASRDRGHFIAQCIGGGYDLNVFSQDRKLNRGWSPEGKVYRQMVKILPGASRHVLLFASNLQ